MDGKAIHRCLHVLDLEKSIAFYEKALGMTEIRRMGPEDGSWTNAFMGQCHLGLPAGTHLEPRAHRALR